ncbi:TPA: hypothetical protein LUJ82_000510 [Acinetobacter baumannii]|uniref:hypothetical protein n=1 Tax=Acinetobacter baumannii TaxID=470 RepID=UPI0005B8254A|nr:hypothetical protein [Acinetobacter baumannii]MDA5804396.1 hypothetical protein [Acinetobacter baumannii]MDQ9758638.1 hypothetical protein [Acinetobacter baumannii]HBM1757712.1 hypothetical protein [Acinetobacter baumannii]HBM1852725.1 hypothetical protein [Acinetobacter baumannii]HBM1986626.1 hypothetical protein [Acinetobacter baumannii]
MIELNGGELDTLYQLAINGPLESGDMPSKSGFVGLCDKGFAVRDLSTWLGHITPEGMAYFKEFEWAKGKGEQILLLKQFHSIGGVQ